MEVELLTLELDEVEVEVELLRLELNDMEKESGNRMFGNFHMLVTLQNQGLYDTTTSTPVKTSMKNFWGAIIQIHPVPLGHKVGAEESLPCASSDRKSKFYRFLQKNVKFGHFTLFVC